MRQHRHIWVLQGPEDPPHLVLLGHIQAAVNGGHDEVEPLQNIVGIVKGSVGQDVHLAPVEDADLRVPGRQGLDLPLSFYLRFLYDEENLDEESILDYVKALEEMLEKNPDYADLRNCLGVAYTILCRYINRKTVKQFNHALRINPDYGAALRNLKLAENDSKGFHLLLNTILRGGEG